MWFPAPTCRATENVIRLGVAVPGRVKVDHAAGGTRPEQRVVDQGRPYRAVLPDADLLRARRRGREGAVEPGRVKVNKASGAAGPEGGVSRVGLEGPVAEEPTCCPPET